MHRGTVPVDSEGFAVRVDVGSYFSDVLVHDNGHDWAEDLFFHQGRLEIGAQYQSRLDVLDLTVDAATIQDLTS